MDILEENNITIERYEDKFEQKEGREEFLDFLHTHLDEYRDSKGDIDKAIDYAFSKVEGKGGFVIKASTNDKIVGGVVINKTGMSGYIPENILVYIAVHKDMRGKGLGTVLMNFAKKACEGGIALHVEYDNPAKKLYEKVGFSSKYAEMRYKNNS